VIQVHENKQPGALRASGPGGPSTPVVCARLLVLVHLNPL